MNQQQEKKLADEIMQEVEAKKALEAMDAGQKGLFNRVLDSVENFEEELKLEHDGCSDDAWGQIKRVLYKVARAAVYCTRKGLEYLAAFIKICRKWIKKADLLQRMKGAWAGLLKRHKDDIPVVEN